MNLGERGGREYDKAVIDFPDSSRVSVLGIAHQLVRGFLSC
jgi:hypothetical protein